MSSRPTSRSATGRCKGTSSYINYFLDRDSRPEHPQPLVQINVPTPPKLSAKAEAYTEEQLAKSK